MKSSQLIDLPVVDDAPTRLRVAESLFDNGASTVAVLAERLDITTVAVRRHLDHLASAGLVDSREERVLGQRRRGRPARVFLLTDAGRERFGHSYDDLAAAALRFLRSSAGDDAVVDFAEERLVARKAKYQALLEGVEPAERARVLADALSADGFAAEISSWPGGIQICQHNCPVAHVATEFPELCDAETRMFSELLGHHVQRLATIANGDGVCTTNLPHPPDDKKVRP